ncbi:MAG: NADH-quinone oxidoreductase subunit H [Pirellulales bacterium]
MQTHIGLLIFHLTVMLVAPIFMVGIINRVKSIWAGRRGPRLHQSFFDLTRLLRKQPVYSHVTSWIFPLAPSIILATTLTAGLFAPVVPGYAPLKFPIDFICFAYILGLGKIFMMLGALDTGSAFEGMGASREATYSALAEPVLLLGLGTLAWAGHAMSFQDLVAPVSIPWLDAGLRIVVATALMAVLLIESSRVPADDPTTHLELTMVHEVMILDHSGPELAFVQYAAALKMTIFAGIIAAVLNPFSLHAAAEPSLLWIGLSMAFSLFAMAAIACSIGLIESLVARLRFRSLPLFTLAAFLAVALALILVNVNRELFP